MEDIVHYFKCFILAIIIPLIAMTCVLILAKIVMIIMPFVIDFWIFLGLINP